MRFKILSVGRERSDPAAPLVADYVERIGRFVPIEDIVLRADREDRLARRMLGEMGPNRLLVALDERGRHLSTEEFSRLLGSWMDRGMSSACFAIGGPDGLPAGVRDRADLAIALSRMTLPHRLARLLLAEQIYRALTILRGVPYQK